MYVKTESFQVKEGVHQGSALVPCSFCEVMDKVTK